MKVLLVLILSLVLPVAAVGPPPFPFSTYPDARRTMPMCDGAAVFAELDDEWRALFSATRDMFAHHTNGEIDYIYLATGTAGSGPVVNRVLTITEARALYPDPCTYLLETFA